MSNLSAQRLVPDAYPIVPLHFSQDNVAASQSDVQLPVMEVTGAAGNTVNGYAMPWKGTIVGVSASLSAAASAGTLTVGPTVDGAEQTDPTLSITTATNDTDTAARGVATFDEGAVIGAEITTSSNWDGTTADLTATVWVMLEVTGV